jgi:hypothetical protein
LVRWASSAEVVDCSSTAAAIVDWKSAIWSITSLSSSIAVTAASDWSVIWPIVLTISRDACSVLLASSLTSLATTAKPLPASPARAASMVALSASRLV